MGCSSSEPAAVKVAGLQNHSNNNTNNTNKTNNEEPPEHAGTAGRAWRHEGRLLFIRHAAAEAGSSRVGLSVRDPGLSDKGQDQAKRLAEQLQLQESARGLEVVCSPMRRCLATAAPLAALSSGPSQGRRAVCHALLCEHGNDPCDFAAASVAEYAPGLFGSGAGRQTEFVGFGVARSVTGPPWDTPSRAEAAVAWLMNDNAKHGSARTASVAVFSHQTFLDCVLNILLGGGTGSAWQYGTIKYKFQNTG
ncbi:unnamed protein product, partial [Polarella glacialis]